MAKIIHRAEHVGSFLRAPSVLKAREDRAAGSASDADLRKIEDESIKNIVQNEIGNGLLSITDGEQRRAYFHLDFLQKVAGVSVIENNLSTEGAAYVPPQLAVTGKLRHAEDIQVEDYLFLKGLLPAGSKAVPKVCIPSPTMVHFRGGRASIDINSYPDLDQFFEDLAQVYREEIAALYKAGCRFIQLDDTNLAYLCDEKMRQAAAGRGEDLNTLPRRYAELINSALRDRPADLTVGIHLCRGNFRSTSFASGGYEPIAEVLFKELNVDIYFLEFDDDRSGDFKPLRFVPKGKVVVLGLISSKIPQLEDKQAIIARIKEAQQFCPLDQLALSAQCGFSSTSHGNNITEQEQWAKVRLVSDIAKEVWQ